MNINREIELRHLRYFIAVAEELHFGRAAAKLGIAQPPLSQQIQRLELLLGVKLFERTSRQVRLTEAGRTFLDGAQRAIVHVNSAIAEVQRVHQGEGGSVTVAFAASVMFHSLPEIIRQFRAQYPGVQLELREMSTGPQIAGLHAGGIDVGFGRHPSHETSLQFATLVAEPLLIALNARHPLASEATVELAQLAHEDFVLFPSEVAPGLHAQVFALCREAGFRPHVVQESRELYTTVSLVEAGVGVTIVPASVRKMGWPGVVYRTMPSRLAQSAIEMVWRTDNRSAAVGAFVNLVLQIIERRDAGPKQQP